MCCRISETVSRIIENVSAYNLSNSFSSLSTLAEIPFAAYSVDLDADEDNLKNANDSQIANTARITDAMEATNERISKAFTIRGSCPLRIALGRSCSQQMPTRQTARE